MSSDRTYQKRFLFATQPFFKHALTIVGHAPERVTTDGHASYPRAVRETLGDQVLHRTNTYLNHRLKPGPSGSQTMVFSHAWLRKRATRLLVSVLLLTSYRTIFALTPSWENRPHPPNSDELSFPTMKLLRSQF